jgi:transcription antitermination factor NusG
MENAETLQLFEYSSDKYSKAETFIKVPFLPIDSDAIEKHFKDVVQNFYYRPYEMNYEVFQQAFTNKKNFHKSILGDQPLITLTNSIPELEYYKAMLDVIIGKMSEQFSTYKFKINGLTFKDREMFCDYFTTLFDDQSLMQNQLTSSIVFDLSHMLTQEDGWFMRRHAAAENVKQKPILKYNRGMKITRFFVSIFDTLHMKDTESEKAIGRFRIDPNDKVDVYITAYPTSFVKAGDIGHSCLSRGGVNEHAGFMAIGYPNVLLVHDGDFTSRAFLAIDHEKKYFTLAHTYPRENFYLQLMTYSFLESQGYKAVSSHFRFPEYMDFGAAQMFQSRVKDLETDYEEKNKDAFFDYSASLLSSASPSSGKISYLYGCEGCDKVSVFDTFENGYCSDCEDNDSYFDCNDCGDRTHNDDAHEHDGTWYCYHCYQQREEELEDEAEETVEAENDEELLSSNTLPLEEIDLGANVSLIKNFSHEHFPSIIQYIAANYHFTNKDFDLISQSSVKICNPKEWYAFSNLFDDTDWIKWRAGENLRGYNPVRHNNTYPYAIIFDNNANSETKNYPYRVGVVSGHRDENVTSASELWIRYVYLGRNILVRKQKMSSLDVNALFGEYAEQAVDLTSKTFISYANIHALSNGKFKKEINFDGGVYVKRAIMYAAYVAGFNLGDFTQTSDEQLNSTKINLNNKGQLSLVHKDYKSGDEYDVFVTEEDIVNKVVKN